MPAIKSLESDFDARCAEGEGRAGTRELVPTFVAAIIGIILSIAAAFTVSLWENRYARLAFNTAAENYSMVLQNGVNEYLSKLLALRALFNSTDDQVTRSEFDAFARPVLEANSAIQTLSWVPRVLHSDRAAHEVAAAHDGLVGYGIKAIAADGSMAPSPEHDEYFPIFYATVPLTSRLYGLDLRSEPATLAELEQARDRDQLGFSQVPALVSADGTQHGFIFSLPVYRRGSAHDTVEDRRRNLVGFVHGSFVTAKMIETIIISSSTPQGFDLIFFEPNSGPNALALHTHNSRLRVQPRGPTPQAALMTGLHWTRTLRAGSQSWMTLVAVPMPEGPLTVRHDRAWIVLIFGLIISAGVAAYLSASGRHALRLARANRRTFELAQMDTLTALANRRAFVARLNKAFAARERGAKPFALLYFDLDHFKDVNDTLGHPVGDALLRQVADRVQGAVRNGDLVARFGGDEFAVLQTDVSDPTDAGALAAKICEIIAVPYLIEGNNVHITASIGISLSTLNVVGPDAMLIQADLALYRAKEDGRNCHRFHSVDLDRQVQERVTIADDLRGAVDRGELELYYQPQVELISGRIIGFEALLRWNHPHRGRISPAVFIPVAERSGQIISLGRWVLNAACRQLRSWQDQGIPAVPMAVNISALQFKGSNDIERDIAASLNRWGIAPAMIEMELTESVLMEVTSQHRNRFENIRRLGIGIAIDDFGTGYSSLNYLTTYPVNRLKIAQELVFGVGSDPRNETVVRTAIRLADELGIEIIAEGIETEGQAMFLLSAGCKYGQGYYFSEAVNAECAARLLRRGKVRSAPKLLRVVDTTAA
jgi:diguanylate cyclase (GGDEF)-like protein